LTARARSTIAIVGTGLIGASIGLALRRRRRTSLTILGWDPVRAHAVAARRRGAIDTACSRFDDAVGAADVIVLAAPLPALEKLVVRALAHAKQGALVIDVGGLKKKIVAVAQRALRARSRGAQFVAGHPMAGSERAGPAAASAQLFERRPFALFAPAQAGRAKAWRAAEAFARALGSRPVRIAPEAHDRVVAATSALPQLAALAIALAVARAAGRQTSWLAGPGFEGATRLAESPFRLWDAALFENRRNASRALRALGREIATIAAALARGERREMSRIFRSAAAARRRICGTQGRSGKARTT
jgi:prephenate dehydrogenase